MNYYNENDKFASQWLKELIKAKLIPQGDVDDRSIIDVEPSDLKLYTQCHFFAGIGGWPYALELSGWDANRPVWSGSCPCQSLSCAGKGLGEKDERHLWPAFHGLIEKLRPTTVFGEQVASKDGREWLSGVRDDLEAVGYAVGAADLPACSVSAPHKRNRLFWVANSKLNGCELHSRTLEREETEIQRGQKQIQSGFEIGNCCSVSCSDGHRRIPIEPAFFPLAHGISSKAVGVLRGAGNAINPYVAKAFIESTMEIQ